MDQQSKDINADYGVVLGSSLPVLKPNNNITLLHHSTVNILNQNKKNLQSPIMSMEEQKIRGELEMDIERDLEQEIKDGIYHLALRLHRLYQQQKERNNITARGNCSESGFGTNDQYQEKKCKKILSEVNICIRLEGGTKIEITETKKEINPEKSGSSRPMTARSTNLQGIVVCEGKNKKKFDWAKSLRNTDVNHDNKVLGWKW